MVLDNTQAAMAEMLKKMNPVFLAGDWHAGNGSFTEATPNSEGETIKFRRFGEPAKNAASHVDDILRYATAGPGFGEPEVKKQKLIFYNSNAARDAHKKPGDVILQGPMDVRASKIEAFDAGKIRTMYVHVCTGQGWSTKLTAEECEVEFLEKCSDSYKAQALGRLRRS